jgi:hypothetical protein
MDASQTRKQIQQMCRFIEQEAREKVNEIKLKVRSDENIDFRNRNRTLISTSRRLNKRETSNLRFLIWRVEGRLIMNLRS